jgi:hypothetical protein
MKHLITTLLIGSFFTLSSFRTDGDIDKVIVALRSGNATELAKYFDDTIELTLPDKSDSYSKAQAQLIIRDFFTNNKVNGFELKHKGDNPNGSEYCIGTLQTNAGNFRTNVLMKVKNGKDVIREIRFQSIE